MEKPRKELASQGPTIGWMAIVLLWVVVLIVAKTVSGPLRFPLAMLLAASMLVALAVGLARENVSPRSSLAWDKPTFLPLEQTAI